MKDYWEPQNDDRQPTAPAPLWDWETAAQCFLFAVACGVFLLVVLPWVVKYGMEVWP